jgi:hypothetical protein
MTHAREHEELLERVLTGALARDAAEVVARCAECGECRAELEQLVEAHATMEAAGAFQREVLAEARTRTGAADVALARRALAVARAGGAAPRRASSAWPWIVGAAAAALLAFLWLRPTEEPSVTLGEGLELLAPVGAGADPTVFSWRFSSGLPSSGRFELNVWERLPGGDERQLLGPIELDATTWHPPPDSLPPGTSIRWRVDAFDAGHVLIDSDERQAELRSP